MKKLYTLLFLLFVLGSNAQVPYSIYYNSNDYLNFSNPADTQYVENDPSQPNNLWQIGPAQKAILDMSLLSAPNAIVTDTVAFYPTNNQSSFILRFLVYNTYGHTLQVDFYYKLDTDSLLDGGTIEISRDSGLTWGNVINDPGYTDVYGMYTSSNLVASLAQPGFSGRNSLGHARFHVNDLGPNACYVYWLRFTFGADSINTFKEGWLIDNFDFYGFLEGIEEADLSNGISIYPNPVHEQFTFTSQQPLTAPATVSFFDANGQLVYEAQNVSDASVHIPDLANGLYFVTFVSGDFYGSKKILIQK